MTPLPFRLPLGRVALLVLAGLVLVLPSALRADDDQQQPPQLSDTTSDALQKLQPLLDAKNWSGAVDLLNGTLASAASDSYDQALLTDTIAKVYMQTDDVVHAADNWETALRLGDEHPAYFEQKEKLEMILSLAQIYYELGSSSKARDVMAADLAKSTAYIERWIQATPKVTDEVQLFYASLLYSRATIDPKHVDQGLIKQAEQQAQKGLRMSVHPSERFYQLIVACAQQSNDMLTASHYFELLVWEYPKVSQYWQDLWLSYMNLAGEAEGKDDRQAREYYVRAINTIERAQSFGFMNKPKDNYNLFTLYYQVDQFGLATDILYRGMKRYEADKAAGIDPEHRQGIDSTVENWEHLGSAYQENNQPERAVAALQEAEDYFPDEGAIDLQMGEIYYYQLQDNAAAYKHFIAAVSKHLAKPYSAWVFAAYTAYSLEKYQNALDAITHAETYPDAAKDHQLERLKQGVVEGLKMQQAMGAAGVPST